MTKSTSTTQKHPTHGEFVLPALIAWGYETGGDFGEAIRVYCETAGVAEPTPAQRKAAERAFKNEFEGGAGNQTKQKQTKQEPVAEKVTGRKARKAVEPKPKKAPRAKAVKAEPAPATEAPAPSPAEKAPLKVKRLELTTRQRDVLQEDATDPGLKADVAGKGKQVTVTAGVLKDLETFASRDGDKVRQRVYKGLVERTRLFIKEHGLKL